MAWAVKRFPIPALQYTVCQADIFCPISQVACKYLNKNYLGIYITKIISLSVCPSVLMDISGTTWPIMTKLCIRNLRKKSRNRKRFVRFFKKFFGWKTFRLQNFSSTIFSEHFFTSVASEVSDRRRHFNVKIAYF